VEVEGASRLDAVVASVRDVDLAVVDGDAHRVTELALAAAVPVKRAESM